MHNLRSRPRRPHGHGCPPGVPGARRWGRGATEDAMAAVRSAAATARKAPCHPAMPLVTRVWTTVGVGCVETPGDAPVGGRREARPEKILVGCAGDEDCVKRLLRRSPAIAGVSAFIATSLVLEACGGRGTGTVVGMMQSQPSLTQVLPVAGTVRLTSLHQGFLNTYTVRSGILGVSP